MLTITEQKPARMHRTKKKSINSTYVAKQEENWKYKTITIPLKNELPLKSLQEGKALV